MKKVLITASTRIHIMNFHLPYIAALRELGWQVDVACGNCHEDIPGADKSISLSFEKKMSSPKNFLAAFSLRRLIKQEGYELLISHTSLAAFFSRLALLGMKKRPAVCNMVHGYLFDDESSAVKKLVMSAAEKLTAPLTDLLITMNKWDDEYARRHRLGRKLAFVHGIGLDTAKYPELAEGEREALRRELGFSNEDFLLVYAAEFSKRKSQAVLIRALKALPEKVCLLLPGDGALLEECKKLAQDLGVAERLRFPGHVKDVYKWYRIADAAVSASRSEGLPFNILEAMHFGLPVVASAVKGHTDLVTDGENGFLYPYGDSRSCAAAVEKLIKDFELVQKFKAASTEKVKNYHLNSVLPEVIKLYLSVEK